MLDEKDLSTGNLSRFDTIVVGIRASQVRRDFVANNGRLLDYVKNGGTMIVQYQQHEYVRENLLPFPAKMDAVVNGTQRISNLRTVDENAPVLTDVGIALLWVAAVITLYTGYDYFRAGLKHMED